MATKATTIRSFLDLNQMELKDLQKKSNAWFMQETQRLAKKKSRGITPNKLLKDPMVKHMSSGALMPGSLYMYFYDAKHKDTLPYWDKFPMVFPFRLIPEKNAFIGLNMHYLPYRQRFQLFAALNKNLTTANVSDRTRLDISWEIIRRTSKLKLAEPCVHMYLLNHVKSQFGKIDPEHWATALMMPVARFQKKSEAFVWRDSIYYGGPSGF